MIRAQSESGKPAMPVPTAGNAMERSFRSQAMRGRSLQRALRRFSSQLHARGMNHEAGAKLATRGDRRAANRYAADRVALLLDCFPTLAPDRARDASAKLQVIVRGVDDGVDIHLGQVALH